jgi:uncharacterized alkaline shock family protein YloU
VTDPTPQDPVVAGSAAEVADLVAAAVRAVPGVADLHAGSFGEVATYLPGRRVAGVRIREDITDVHVVTLWGAPVPATADAVRFAVQPIVSTPVHVVVEDVLDPTAGGGVSPARVTGIGRPPQ